MQQEDKFYMTNANKTDRFCILGLFLCLFAFTSTFAYAQGAVDPCPDPKAAMQNTPDSMVKIQEDIDRFALCVERAQLLDRLNSMVEKNIDTIDSVLIQPAPAPAILPTIGNMGGDDPSIGPEPVRSTTPSPIDEAALTQNGDDELSAMGENSDVIDEAPEEPVWLIREINGKSGLLQANLVNSSGSLARVKQGDILPDESRVIEITPVSIKVKKEQEIIDLQWVSNNGDEE